MLVDSRTAVFLAETNLYNGQLCIVLSGFILYVVSCWVSTLLSSAEKNWKEKIEGGVVWIWRIHLSNDGHTKINLIRTITLVIYKI